MYTVVHMQEGDPSAPETEQDTKDIVDINVASACLFMVLASGFLLLLYFFMSEWFLRLLVIIFCIGGFEVLWFLFIDLDLHLLEYKLLLLQYTLVMMGLEFYR